MALGGLIAGNAALVSFENVTYDVGTNGLLPTSNTVTSGTFFVNGNGIVSNAVNAGILSSILSFQGLAVDGTKFGSERRPDLWWPQCG